MCLDYIVDLHITLRVQIFNDMPQNSKNGLGEELHVHTLSLLQPTVLSLLRQAPETMSFVLPLLAQSKKQVCTH